MPANAPATLRLMNCDEITAHPTSSPDATTLKSRNHTSALNEARPSHLGNSALRITSYLTGFLPRRETRNAIAMHNALSKDAIEKFEPSDRNRPERLPASELTTRPTH